MQCEQTKYVFIKGFEVLDERHDLKEGIVDSIMKKPGHFMYTGFQECWSANWSDKKIFFKLTKEAQVCFLNCTN